MYNLIIEDIKKCTNEQSKKEVKDLFIRNRLKNIIHTDLGISHIGEK